MKLHSFIVFFFLSTAVFLSTANERIPEDTTFIMLRELSVTAVKSVSSVDLEAQAVTILNRNELEELNIVTMRGISDVVPNFYMPDYGSRITSTIYVRGIGARMDQPSIGLNVDNIPYLNKDAYDFDVADIDHVEMLRGPQSTLYGRNTMAGVINITTLSPMKFQGWRIFADLGNGGRAKATLSWLHKFNQKWGLSASFDYSHLAGFFLNEFNGEKTDKENNFGLRIKTLFSPSYELNFQNTASLGYLKQSGYPYEYIKTGKIEYNDTCFYHRFTLADGLSINLKKSAFELTSLTSVQHIDDNMTLDQDFLPLDYFTLTQKKKETSFTEEVVIKGNKNKYSWLGGIFGFYKHLNMDAPVTFKNIGISELIESHRNEANPYYPIEWDSRKFRLNSNFTIPTWGLAVYHESDFKTGNFTFTGGLRLDYEKSNLDYHSFCNTGYTIYKIEGSQRIPYLKIPIDIDDKGNLAKDFINLLPSFSASYTFQQIPGNIYAKFSKGYKAGGFNTQMFSDVLQQRLMSIMGIGSRYDVEDIVSYKPEKSWNYEIGTHISLFHDKLDLEAAIFYIDCRDQQLTMFPDGNTTGRIMTNAGKTRSFGGELSFSYKISDKYSINGSYGYTNAKFREFFNGINDFSGKFLPYVPGNTIFLQGLCRIPLSNKNNYLLIDLNLKGTGKIYWNEENSLKQNLYFLLGGNLSLNINNLEIKIWSRNLTSTKYYTFYFMSMGNEFLQRGRPVEYGISFRMNI